MGVGGIGKDPAFEHEIDLVGIRILAAELVIGAYVLPYVAQRSDINTYAKLLEALAPEGVGDRFTWILAPSGKGVPVPLRVPVLDHQEAAFKNDHRLSRVAYMLHEGTNSRQPNGLEMSRPASRRLVSR